MKSPIITKCLSLIDDFINDKKTGEEISKEISSFCQVQLKLPFTSQEEIPNDLERIQR